MAPKKTASPHLLKTRPSPFPSSLSKPSPSLSSSSSIPPSPLPIAHYIPRLPLQLLAILFCFFAASSSVVKDASITGLPRLVQALTLDPLAVLPLACGLAALVQTWFGYWARSCRDEAKKAAEKAKNGAAGGEEKQKEPVKQKNSSVSDSLNELWNRILVGEAPHQRLWKQAKNGELQQKLKGMKGLDTRFVPQAASTTLGAAFVFHAIAVLLGAPLFSHIPETFLLSLLVSILAILPLSIAIPPFTSQHEQYIWLRLFSSLTVNDDLEFALFAPALGAILGCWLGAVPIPLDWDRPWQKWPTTCLLGTLFGFIAGSLVSLAVTGWRGALVAAADVVREAKEEEEKKAKGKGRKEQ